MGTLSVPSQCLDILQSHYFPRRYLQLCPEEAEDAIEYLIGVGRLDEAAVHLAKVVNDNDFVSKRGKSNHTLWHELCELISKNPHKVKSLNVDAIIRGGLRRYTDQIGNLWNSLAEYYTRSGLFERARYEIQCIGKGFSVCGSVSCLGQLVNRSRAGKTLPDPLYQETAITHYFFIL